MMDYIEPSFWDAEDDDSKVNVRDMTVAPATTKDCAEFIRRYHYSGGGGGALWRYGLWHGMTLWGIVAYNLPTRETCESVFGPDHFDKVAHMSRLACAEHAPRNSESRLIGGSLKLLQRDQPHLWAVLTYADILQEHIGYVYQATNAIYTGIGAKGVSRYVTPSGEIKGTYISGHGISKQEGKDLGWTEIAGMGKHRYVYLLGNRSERKQRRSALLLDEMQYPKP